MATAFDETCERIFHAWDAAASAGDVDGLVALYTEDCWFETALVPVILPDKVDGVLRGKPALREFVAKAAANRPDEVLKFYRTGRWLSDGVRHLAWEYPRLTPDGEQSDVAEFLDIHDGLVAAHRVYWGWKSAMMLAPGLVAAAGADAPSWTAA